MLSIILTAILTPLGYGWAVPGILAIVAAGTAPTVPNIETAFSVGLNAVITKYDPSKLPEVQAIEATVFPIIPPLVALIEAPNVVNGEAFASAAIIAIGPKINPNVTPDSLQQATTGLSNVINELLQK